MLAESMPFTLDTLEAFVSSAHYDSVTADMIASRIPTLKAAGQPGEHIAPGITRIHGNLCNVHGKYGPCDKALSGKKPKGGARKPRKPAKPKVDRAAQHAKNRAATLTAQGFSADDQAALGALRTGAQPAKVSAALIDKGLVEQASDGSYRMTASGRALMGAADQGDQGRAHDTASGAADRLSARNARRNTAAQHQQESATRRAQATANREQARKLRADAAAKKRAEAQAGKRGSGGGKKKPDDGKETPLKVRPTKRVTHSSSPAVGSLAPNKPPPKPKPAKPEKPEKAPAKQIAPALQAAAQDLSDGKELSEDDTQALIRNGLARLNKDGLLTLTAAGMRATLKVFRVFKDANGADRWVAQSSTAFQDRDQEIVSTKALADDVAFADETGSYGPLRWWHTPGLDLGDCDFNAMHGRILIESGTFRSPAIAQKVAENAAGLEISLGFLHLPSEPDAQGVFHHIRRFERSLVPRGKASNRFTAFTVKETRMFDPKKVEYMKTELKFSDDMIAEIEARATATEKAADDANTAYKADEPLPDVIINGVTYKAFPPKALADTGVNAPVAEEDKAMPGNAQEDAMDGGADDAQEEPMDDGAVTLSGGDQSWLDQLIDTKLQAFAAQIIGALDLEKKVAGHVQGMLAPYQQAQTTKDAEQAQTREQLTQLQQQVAELTGDQPAKPYRASEAKNTALTDATMLAAAKQLSDPNAADPWADIRNGLGLSRPQ